MEFVCLLWQLNAYKIPDSVTSMSERVFANSFKTAIYCQAKSQPESWPSSWNSYGRPVIWDCDNNDVADDGNIYKVVDGVRYTLKDGVATVGYQPMNIISANILSSVTHKDVEYPVTSIQDDAFNGRSNLTSVVIGDGITSIGESAFFNCSNLISVEIGSGVQSLHENTFAYCNNLTSIEVSENNTKYCDIDGNLYAKKEKGLWLIQYSIGKTATQFIIPDEVIWIDSNAFCDAINLTSVVIPGGIKQISSATFSYCENLTSAYYCGSEFSENWKSILEYVDGENPIPNATVYFYSETVSKNCWHYDENGVVVLWNED